MSRIPYVRRDELGPEGQQLWDGIVNGRGDQVLTADGALAGPFNAFVTAPDAGRRLSALGATLRFGTSIERRLSEVAIITVGARWRAEFEWWAHAPMAREHGVAGAVVDAIGRGEEPPFEADDERAVYAVARELGQSGRLEPGRHAARAGGLPAQPGPHRAPAAVWPAGDGLGGGLRHGVAAVRRIQLRQRAPAGPRRRRDQLRITRRPPVAAQQRAQGHILRHPAPSARRGDQPCMRP